MCATHDAFTVVLISVPAGVELTFGDSEHMLLHGVKE